MEVEGDEVKEERWKVISASFQPSRPLRPRSYSQSPRGVYIPRPFILPRAYVAVRCMYTLFGMLVLEEEKAELYYTAESSEFLRLNLRCLYTGRRRSVTALRAGIKGAGY